MILIPVTAALDRVRAILDAAVRPEGRLRGAMAISPSGRGLPVRGFPTSGAYIAASAAAHDFAVASRDGSAFEAAGLAVIDPWNAVR